MYKYAFLTLAVVALLLSGCVSVSPTPPEERLGDSIPDGGIDEDHSTPSTDSGPFRSASATTIPVSKLLLNDDDLPGNYQALREYYVYYTKMEMETASRFLSVNVPSGFEKVDLTGLQEIHLFPNEDAAKARYAVLIGGVDFLEESHPTYFPDNILIVTRDTGHGDESVNVRAVLEASPGVTVYQYQFISRRGRAIFALIFTQPHECYEEMESIFAAGMKKAPRDFEIEVDILTAKWVYD